MDKIRIDKWLWAARFYKTRSLATDEIGKGRVEVNDQTATASREVKVGDTITHVANPGQETIAGFTEVKPMVFAGIYPVDTEDYEELRESMEKLQLNDASLTFELETSQALGFGFRCGFLGLLHMEIIQERLRREFNMDIIATYPSVIYEVEKTNGEVLMVGALTSWTVVGLLQEHVPGMPGWLVLLISLMVSIGLYA